jgi:hypothetical protein
MDDVMNIKLVWRKLIEMSIYVYMIIQANVFYI